MCDVLVDGLVLFFTGGRSSFIFHFSLFCDCSGRDGLEFWATWDGTHVAAACTALTVGCYSALSGKLRYPLSGDHHCHRLLIVGSGNALLKGRIVLCCDRALVCGAT